MLDPGVRGDRPERPYSIDTLMDAAGLDTDGQLALIVGVGRTMVQKRRQRDGLTFWEADRWAVACGLMPYAVWPSWVDDEIVDGLDWDEVA
jgi:hypothetical protein